MVGNHLGPVQSGGLFPHFSQCTINMKYFRLVSVPIVMVLYNTTLISLCCLMPPLRVTIKTEQQRKIFWNVYKVMVEMDLALFPR